MRRRKCWRLLGQAYGALSKSGQLREDQDAFLNRAIGDLTIDDRVICVQLALFAAMVKDKRWELATWKTLGGATNVGVAFLEDSFDPKTAPREYRHHSAAAQRVLAALLPEPDTTIKGAMRTRQELLQQSGYRARPKEFEQLLEILDTKLLPCNSHCVGRRQNR